MFADRYLERTGRCHVTDVERAFRKAFARYRSEDALSDKELRNLIANWHPQAERTSSGFYKNMSLRDPEAEIGVMRSMADEVVAAKMGQ